METLVEKNKDQKIRESYKDIPGWGIDADPENDPAYPMKMTTGADHQRLNYPKAPQQPRSVEVLHSNERPGITRVFGTSVPPQGLSGMLRRYAFKFSESSSAHWLTLILADRINVVEGIVEDIKHGHVPNLFVEKGWRAEWRYNRKAFTQKIAIGAAVTTVALTLLYLNKSRSKKTSLK